MKYGLSEEQIQEIKDFIAGYPEVKEAILFGSRAQGTFKEASDVDIAIKGKNANAAVAAKMKFNIEEDTYLPFMFDFVAYATITKASLLKEIDRKGVVLFRRGGGWRECKLGDVAIYVNRGIAPKYNESSGITILNQKCIRNGKINFQLARFHDSSKNFTKDKQLIIGDLLINSTGVGTAGRVGIFKSHTPTLADSHITILRLDKMRALPSFVFQNLRDREKELEETAEGSTGQIELKRDGIKDLEIFLPPLPEQKAIAGVLSSLDDKIDLLHRQNKTLEAMAETLFRQWFVEEADEGWEKSTLYDAINLIGGGTPKTSIEAYWNGDVNWLSGGDIASNHKSIIIESEKMISKEGLKNSSAKLIPQFSTVITARGTVGKYCMLSKPMTYSQSNYGITPKIENTYFFTYLLISHSIEELQSAAYGSVFDTITTNTFKGMTIALPTDDVIKKFEIIVSPLFKKIFLNQKKSCTLKKIRDSLLPKLMNGEAIID